MPAILQIENVSKYIGELVLFEGVNLELSQGDKAALIGVNGAGKSTLLNLITHNDQPDSGRIELTPSAKLAYLPQEPHLQEDETVIDSLFKTDNKLIVHIKEYEEALLSGDVKIIEKTGLSMEHLKLWDFENRIKQILTQLNIVDFHQKIGELSGGQKKRIALANAILNEPDLLILDEPTNHLDLEAIEWLESYLQRSSLSLIMVTHDRFFLNRVCNRIFEIDQKMFYKYEGNYNSFIDQREKRIELEELAVAKARNLLRKEEEWMRRMPKARGTKAKYRIDRYYSLKEASSKRRDDKQINLNIREARVGSKILVARDLSFAWNNSYYLKNFSYTFSRFEKAGIIGKNGTGKTTFLEILTQNLKPEKGSIETGETIRFGYYRQSGMAFDETKRVLEALTEIAETVTIADGSRITVSQFLTYFLFPHQRQNDYIYKLSGGEKRRLYLCQVLMQNPNFLILDEPTNDLDIESLQVLEDYLAAFNGSVIVVSHDRYFMDNVVDHLFIFHGEGMIKDFPGSYSDYFEWQKSREKEKAASDRKAATPVKPSPKKDAAKLSYKEKKELEHLEGEIDKLEKLKASLEDELGNGKLTNIELVDKSEKMAAVLLEIEAKTNRWIELSDKQ